MYISSEQSNIMKAITMLLIILGHNHILAPQNSTSHLMGFLYSFHVSIFFILPFFYNKKEVLNKESIYKIMSRNGIPFLLFFTSCYLIYHFIINRNGFNLSEFCGGIVNAPGYNVKNTTGFVFLWFLPVFMLTNLCKIIGCQYKWAMIIFFVIGIIIGINREAYVFMWHAPFYILKAVYYYAMGLSAYFLYKYIKYANYVGSIIFIILTILYWTNNYYINTFYFSLTAFCALQVITTRIDFSKILFLKLIGKYSLPIYLIHIFIYNILEKILPHTLIIGWIIYIITVTTSLIISMGIYQIETLRCFLFPKSWKEWKSLFEINYRKKYN